MFIYIYIHLLRSHLLALVLLTSAFTTMAQTEISLEQAIERARQNNRSILIANQSTEIHKAELEQTKAHFLPYIGVKVTDVITNNPLNVFGIKLLQEQVVQSDFDPTLLNNPDARNQFNMQLNVMMHLFNPEAKAQQKAVKSQIDMQDAMAHRTSQGIELEVTQYYYQLLLSQKAVEIMQETYDAALSNYQEGNNFFDQGLLLKSELLEMQIMVNQSKLALGTAKMNLANAQSQFNHIINTEEFTEFLPTDTLIGKDFLSMDADMIDNERADFRAMIHGISALHHVMDAADKSFIPKLQAFGSLEMNDEIPFENAANNYQVGLTLSWDIFKGNIRNSTRNKTKVEIQKQEMVLDQKRAEAHLEMINTRRAIVDLKSQIDLHDLSLVQAEEALKIRKNRFKQGLEKSTDVVSGETNLSHKKLARLQALFELNMKIAYLNFILK